MDIDQLRELSQGERARLLRALVALESPDPAADRAGRRKRAMAVAVIIVCCVVLAAWIGVLAVTLPRYYRSGGWRGAWVGFDLALLAAFAVTGWAAWRRRQILIICLVVLATLLCCDAWFDVVLDARTKGFELSLLSAVFIELPLAAVAILGARRLLRMNVAVIRRYQGQTGRSPSLRQVRLVGGAPGSQLSDVFRDCDEATGSYGDGRVRKRGAPRNGGVPRNGNGAGPEDGPHGELAQTADAENLPAPDSARPEAAPADHAREDGAAPGAARQDGRPGIPG